jgi:hypothetical protein
MTASGTSPTGRRGRQPLPPEDRGDTISCYLPRWAIDQLAHRADGARLSRNKLVRHIVMDYLARPEQGRTLDETDAPTGQGEAR